jgi:peptide-methionine (S)-S-oxide reductase
VKPSPSYSEMKDHTESVLIEFEANIVSYQSILQKWKALSDPYPTKRQYRTAVFFFNDEQEKIAREICQGMEHVAIEPVTKFFMGEARHQDFMARL